MPTLSPAEMVDRWNGWTEDERTAWMQEAKVTARPLSVANLIAAAFPDWTAERVAEEAAVIESRAAA